MSGGRDGDEKENEKGTLTEAVGVADLEILGAPPKYDDNVGVGVAEKLKVRT